MYSKNKYTFNPTVKKMTNNQGSLINLPANIQFPDNSLICISDSYNINAGGQIICLNTRSSSFQASLKHDPAGEIGNCQKRRFGTGKISHEVS